MRSKIADSFDGWIASLDNLADVHEIRVEPTTYGKLMFEAGRFHSKGNLNFHSRLVYITDFGDIPIVKEYGLKDWLVIRKSDFEEKPQVLAEVKDLLPKMSDARVQTHKEYRIEDTTDGDRCIIAFALEEGMIPVIHHFVGWREADRLLHEFNEHHTITLNNYHHMTEAKFRPVWISISRETHMLQKTTRMRAVDTGKKVDADAPTRMVEAD